MATQKELERLLVKLSDAGKELRATITEAHVARRDLLDAQKKHRDQITAAIAKQVQEQVAAILESVQAEMRERASAAVDQLVAEWRRKLGLDPVGGHA